jgi:hypothetical protein
MPYCDLAPHDVEHKLRLHVEEDGALYEAVEGH